MQNSSIFTIFAGVNGAGKSTLYHMEKNENLGFRLNSDEILKDSGGDWNSLNDQIQAGKQLLKMQDDCFSKKISLNRETTIVGTDIIKSIKIAKDLGYVVNLRYVGVASAEIAKERIKKRIQLGGHGVSNETVDRRFDESFNNFIKIYKLCDNVFVYDNSGKEMLLVGFLKNGKLKRTSTACLWCDDLFDRAKNL